jgi:hypothetical protein
MYRRQVVHAQTDWRGCHHVSIDPEILHERVAYEERGSAVTARNGAIRESSMGEGATPDERW